VETLSLFNFFFNKVLVYTALNNDDYFNVAKSFKNEGLHYKVKSKSRNSSTPGQHFNVNDFRAPVIYDFYVKKEDQYKAQNMMTVMTEGLNQLPSHLGAHGTAASNTARQVAGGIGTALLVTVMTTRQGVHYGEYTNTITSSNPFISSTFSQLSQGLSALTHLPQLPTYMIYGQTMQQATIDGIKDAFIVATGIAFVALILAFFIKRARVNE
jgi:hypothetical protein